MDPQEGEGSNPVPEETSENTEYVINKVIDHGYQDEKLFLKVDWYGYAIENATWEPSNSCPAAQLLRIFEGNGCPCLCRSRKHNQDSCIQEFHMSVLVR